MDISNENGGDELAKKRKARKPRAPKAPKASEGHDPDLDVAGRGLLDRRNALVALGARDLCLLSLARLLGNRERGTRAWR